MKINKLDYLARSLRYRRYYSKYKSQTMIHRRHYVENLVLASLALEEESTKNGAIVECGTWRGGMAAGLVEIGGQKRRYCFFDSFEGLPPVQQIDGTRARTWQQDTNSPGYHNNCLASLEEFKDTLRQTGCPQEMIDVRKGFFEESFPDFYPPPVAVLRLDADWYASTMICLQKFWHKILPKGIVLIDDYYYWDGCSRAVHDFLSQQKAAERIRQGPRAGVAYIQKELSPE